MLRVLRGQGDQWDNRARARGVTASFSLNGIGLVPEEPPDLLQENEELKVCLLWEGLLGPISNPGAAHSLVEKVYYYAHSYYLESYRYQWYFSVVWCSGWIKFTNYIKHDVLKNNYNKCLKITCRGNTISIRHLPCH